MVSRAWNFRVGVSSGVSFRVVHRDLNNWSRVSR